MRTMTTLQEWILDQPSRSTWVRVSVDRGSSDWVDLSNLFGLNWIKGVRYGHNIDSIAQTATITLFKQTVNDQGGELSAAPGMSLSPLVTGLLSLDGTILDAGNPIVVEVAVTAADVDPVETDWIEVHRGEIDEVDFGPAEITVQSRDQAGILVDTMTEHKSVFGSEAGTAIEDTIQDVLDDGLWFTTAPLLYSVNGDDTSLPGSAFAGGDSPGYNIGPPYEAEQSSVADRIQKLTSLLGADVRYKWHDNTDDWQLVWFSVPRSTPAIGSVTFTGVPANNDTLTINGVVLTAKTTPSTTNEFKIGSSAAQQVALLLDFFLGYNRYTDGSPPQTCTLTGTLTASGNGSTTIYLTWGVTGTAGNAITFTESLTNATIDGGGFLGGYQAGVAGTDTSVWTFDPQNYYQITRASVSRMDIRNVVEVVVARAGSTVSPTQSIVVADSASITAYGRRYMKITEDTASQIDTFNEAHEMAVAILQDLKQPTIRQTVEMPFFWPAEVNDYYTFAANGVHYTSSQNLLLVGVEHNLTTSSATTTLQLE